MESIHETISKSVDNEIKKAREQAINKENEENTRMIDQFFNIANIIEDFGVERRIKIIRALEVFFL